MNLPDADELIPLVQSEMLYIHSLKQEFASKLEKLESEQLALQEKSADLKLLENTLRNREGSIYQKERALTHMYRKC